MGTTLPPVQLRLRGQPGERAEVVQGFEAFCREGNVPRVVANAADVALEEHLTNVLGYGYEPGAAHEVVVELRIDGGCLHMEVRDDGKSFNPLTLPDPDISLPLEEKPIGGLGLHLIRHLMDEVSYARVDERNVFRMKKRLAA